MDIKYDQALVKDFPNLYRNRYGDMRTTAMVWGFECGDGWKSLIRQLSEKLETMILQIPEEERKLFCASQVKEKFGSLRFYMSGATDEMYKAIDDAEKESVTICEECGKKGKIRSNGWLMCLCRKCAATWKPRRYPTSLLEKILNFLD